MAFVDVTNKDNIIPGLLVEIVVDKDRETQELTRGYVKKVLSKSDSKKGIRVELTTGEIGNVKYVPSKHDIKKENFKFYNEFFFRDKIFSIWDKSKNSFLVIGRMNKISGKVENITLLFTEKEIANNTIKGTSLDSPNYVVRQINRKKSIVGNYSEIKVDFFSIDGSRKLSFDRMIEWEAYFKNMR
jgi:Uncharacterized conserved protein